MTICTNCRALKLLLEIQINVCYCKKYIKLRQVPLFYYDILPSLNYNIMKTKLNKIKI